MKNTIYTISVSILMCLPSFATDRHHLSEDEQSNDLIVPNRDLLVTTQDLNELYIPSGIINAPERKFSGRKQLFRGFFLKYQGYKPMFDFYKDNFLLNQHVFKFENHGKINPNAFKNPFKSYVSRYYYFFRALQTLLGSYEGVRGELTDIMGKYTGPDSLPIVFEIFRQKLEQFDNFDEMKDILDDVGSQLNVINSQHPIVGNVHHFIPINYPKAVQYFPSEEGNGQKVIVVDKFEKRSDRDINFSKTPIYKKINNPDRARKIKFCNHACHVSGLIVAQENGLAPRSTFIPKRMGDMGDNLVNALKDIITNDEGAKVINLSIGSDSNSLSKGLKEIKTLCEEHIVVLALGNNSRAAIFTDDFLNDDNIQKHLIVAVNVMPDGEMISPTSNFPGDNTRIQDITLAAPGTWITSSNIDTNGKEVPAISTGTSMAAPIITGLFLRLLSDYPDMPLEGLVQIVKENAQKSCSHQDRLLGNGLIDVYSVYNALSE